MNVYGLIGFPLTHSFSARYFQQKFSDQKISDAVYRLFPLSDISQIHDLLDQEKDLKGFNVTIPYKIAVIPKLSRISQLASEVGAVNCVKVIRESSEIKLHGYNTDVYGFRHSLLPVLKSYHYNALILGTGGAAKAVSHSLLELGISNTYVSRDNNYKFGLSYSKLTKEVISNNLVIINTTPAGTYPDTDNCPDIPYHFLTSQHLLFDLIYNPEETLFLKKGATYGAKIMNGLKMLELQAEKSWEIWNTSE